MEKGPPGGVMVRTSRHHVKNTGQTFHTFKESVAGPRDHGYCSAGIRVKFRGGEGVSEWLLSASPRSFSIPAVSTPASKNPVSVIQDGELRPGIYKISSVFTYIAVLWISYSGCTSRDFQNLIRAENDRSRRNCQLCPPKGRDRR